MQWPEHLLIVQAKVAPEHEEKFNSWYNAEHIPDAMRLFQGCLGAARYRVVDGDGSHQYIAAYAFASRAAVDALMLSDGLKEMIRRYNAAVGDISTRTRTTYERVCVSRT